MLRLKYMASNTYVTLDPKSQIPYHKKQKNIATLEAFKTKIRRWKSICTCRICRIYIRIVFICQLYVFAYIEIGIQLLSIEIYSFNGGSFMLAI